jgi:hypothetical protein
MNGDLISIDSIRVQDMLERKRASMGLALSQSCFLFYSL